MTFQNWLKNIKIKLLKNFQTIHRLYPYLISILYLKKYLNTNIYLYQYR